MPDTERIVKDLRFLGNMGGTYLPGQGDTFAHEAADEIERLQAENAALKQRLEIDDAMVERRERPTAITHEQYEAALEAICDEPDHGDGDCVHDSQWCTAPSTVTQVLNAINIKVVNNAPSA